MKYEFTVDIDRKFTKAEIEKYKKAYAVPLDVLSSGYGMTYEFHESAHGNIHVDFTLHTEQPFTWYDIFLMRAALGDDIHRLRTDGYYHAIGRDVMNKLKSKAEYWDFSNFKGDETEK